MSVFLRTIVAASCLGWAPALAGPAPAAKDAPAKAEAPRAARKVTIKFQGTLRDAIKAIADKGGLNLMITGELKEPAEVYLNDVPADEALQIVSDAHGLKVRRQGTIWTIRPLTAEEREELADSGSDIAEEPEEPDHGDVAEEEPLAATAPTPPTPPSASDDGDDIPDPVSDPKGFQRHIEERVQRDLRSKLMRKFRDKRFGSGDGNDVVGTGHLEVGENETVGDAVSYGGGLEVKGHVEGDAVAFGGGVHLGPTAQVDGDVYSFGGGITKEDGASVDGEEVAFGGGFWPLPGVRHKPDPEHKEPRVRRSHGGTTLPGFLAWFAVLFGGGFLAMMFAPNRMRLLEAELKRDPVRCGVTGLLGMIGLIPLSVVLIVTVIGIPVALGLWVVTAVGWLMGLAALANQIGTRLPLRNVRKTQAVVLAAGVLLMLLVGLIPVLGGLVWGVIGFLSLGTIIRSRFGTRQLGPVAG